MKITFDTISSVEFNVNSSGCGSLKINCPIEDTNGSEIELEFKKCEFELLNNEIVIKKIYIKDNCPVMIVNER